MTGAIDPSFLADAPDGSTEPMPLEPKPALLRLLPVDLLPGDEVRIFGDWLRVLTLPEAREEYIAVGVQGLDTEMVNYFDRDRQLTVRRPLTPWPSLSVRTVAKQEFDWLGQIRNRRW